MCVALLGLVLLPPGGNAQEVTEPVCRVEGGAVVTARVGTDEARRLIEETRSYPGPCAEEGLPAVLGGVTVVAYGQTADDGTPHALGFRLDDHDRSVLPSEPADGFRCLDLDDDDRIDVAEECVGGHERVLFLPTGWAEAVGSPFTWALFNWNPDGHAPPGIWDVAHFDFHFFIQSLEERNRIRLGRCAMLVDCDDLEVGTRPVPDSFLPAGYEDRGVVEFGMGNHLIDPATFGTLEVRPTHTMIYGAWAGAVSFLEPMVTYAFLRRMRLGQVPSGCHEVPQPGAVAVSGHYPTLYCVRWLPNRGEFRVSLEGFRWREASGGRE